MKDAQLWLLGVLTGTKMTGTMLNTQLIVVLCLHLVERVRTATLQQARYSHRYVDHNDFGYFLFSIFGKLDELQC